MVNIDMLMGTGNYTRAEGQAGYEPLVQEQCQQTGMAALVQTTQLATPQQPFATIVQGVDEPFLCFAGWLTAAVEKQWPLSLAKTSIAGLGGMKQCYVSQNPVAVMNLEGQSALIWPHVTEIAQNLWGRDASAMWGVRFGTDF
ncbi:hypothetical protein DUI87_02141 [Hirundo rustica rustica]|uniref:Uncharacterized protein n=1 Tax=Hirundo rustica rustica TaxID=333673 RepID=A0A3M0LE88_HIRRU|nr:hypothetical protein DUI87_02141 [Hirundo rustica rustica]